MAAQAKQRLPTKPWEEETKGPSFAIVKRCRNCSKISEQAALFICSRCGRSHYCSKKCQKEDWKRHKPECTEKPLGMDEAITRCNFKEIVRLGRRETPGDREAVATAALALGDL